jgi:hypothetical protein
MIDVPLPDSGPALPDAIEAIDDDGDVEVAVR